MQGKATGVSETMLKVTTELRRGRVILSVEGQLSGPRVATLDECWRELRHRHLGQKFFLNLCGVSFIDSAGKVLLKEIHRQGGALLAEGCLNQAIVEEILAGEKTASERAKKRLGKPQIFFYGFFLCAILFPAGMQAQEAPARLTLEGAVKLALRQNPSVQIALLAAAEQEQDKNIARSALLPQAGLGVSDAARRQNLETGIGQRIPGAPQHTGPFQVFTAGTTFGTPVLDLSLWRRYQAAQETARAAKAAANVTREQVVLLVVSQYIGTLRAAANVKASESRVALAQALYDQAADLQRAGVGTGIDTLRANVELQNEKQRLIQAQTERDSSLFALSRLLNLDPRKPVELADTLAFFETPQPEMETSIEQGLAARPEWKAQEAQIRAARNARKAASESRLPSLRADGNWSYQGVSSTTGIPVYTYQASVNMPLFTGGRIRAEIARADLEMRRLEQQQADLRNEIALEVKTALLNLESARNEVGVATLGVKLAAEEVEQARDRFKAGVANNIEVVTAQDALARANDNHIAALYRFNQARADLARATGQMEKLYAN